MNEQNTFMADFGSLFPATSVSMAARCWRDIKGMPDVQRGDLVRAISSGAAARIAASAADAATITAAIGGGNGR